VSQTGAAAALSGVHGVVIPGGFGVRGIEGKIGAARYAREQGIPVLGLCLGLQCMTIEVARHLAGLPGANSGEFDEATAHPVIATMADQTEIVAGRGDLGGTMRLGSYPAVLVPGSLAAQAYGRTEVAERHRHRYEVNNSYRDVLTRAGLRISGTSPDGRLVEFVELDPDVHPFFVATQAHPELKSRPTRPHPLFADFVGAALRYADADRLPVELTEPAASR
jgi:CTP synthase